MRCVDLYNQTQSKWFEEMVTTSMVKTHGKLIFPTITTYTCLMAVFKGFKSDIQRAHGPCVCFARLVQELEKLEVDRIEWIQQHLRQYTTLRHETDMFNQSVSFLCVFLSKTLGSLRKEIFQSNCSIHVNLRTQDGSVRVLFLTTSCFGQI